MLKINEIRSGHELNTEELKKKVSKILSIKSSAIKTLTVLKRSVDARHKGEILFIYCVSAEVSEEDKVLKRVKDSRVSKYQEKSFEIPVFSNVSNTGKGITPPVIAGFGPAGMFAALYLSYAGLNPIVIERGEDADSRVKKVKEFWESGKLDINSNVQFGEGGAGTFSDGKLNTGVRDRENRNGFVLKSFVKYGAPESILTDNKPHIGSDILCEIVKNIRCDIIEHGGSIRFNSRLSGFETDSDGCLKAIKINDDEYLSCEKLILAIGHSARDTFEFLNEKHVLMEPKSFAAGVRVQHLQEDINKAMYGETDIVHKAADYKLTFHASDAKGVYSFCMCPGGYVVNSSSEENMLCVNGMSYSGRDGKNANSAMIVTVTPEDFVKMGYANYGVLSGMEFQRELERRAYSISGGAIPCQRFEDFKENRESSSFGRVSPECKGRYASGNLREVLPEFITEDIIAAFSDFGKRISGFDSPDTVFSGVESRTSSPVRILRNECFLSSVPGIFPAGEGAGYAGGIMSAAIDGLKCAEALIKTLV